MSAFANFAKGTVARGYGATDATVLLAEGHTDRFPSPPFNATYWNGSDYPNSSDDPNVEIVTVTQISNDYLSLVRGAEGTSASTKNAAGKTYFIAQSITAATLDQLLRRPLTGDAGIANGEIYFRHQSTSKYHSFGIAYDPSGVVRVLVVDDVAENQITIHQIDTGSLYGNACYINGTLFLKDPTSGLYREIFLDYDAFDVNQLFASDEVYSTISVTSTPTNDFTGFFTFVNGHAYFKHRTTELYHEATLITSGLANIISISDETFS